MKHTFDTSKSLIIVTANVWGPRSDSPDLEWLLDTAAGKTVVGADMMEMLGYNLAACREKTKVITASGYATGYVLTVPLFHCLGCVKRDFPVLCHHFPKGSTIEGLIGLNFFQNHELNINFRTGTIELK